MSQDLKRIVAAGYDAVAACYADLEADEEQWPRLRWLRGLLGQVPAGGAVLDIGCATGARAAAEIAQRHRVTGIDISAAQIEQATQHVPEGTFVAGDATQVEFPAATFDAVVSFYSFDHIPREQHAPLLQRIHDWLRPGGWLLVSIEDADQPGTVANWLGVEMFFSMFDSETTRQLVVQAGFTIEESSVEYQSEGGDEIGYVWILARKPEDVLSVGGSSG